MLCPETSICCSELCLLPIVPAPAGSLGHKSWDLTLNRNVTSEEESSDATRVSPGSYRGQRMWGGWGVLGKSQPCAWAGLEGLLIPAHTHTCPL